MLEVAQDQVICPSGYFQMPLGVHVLKVDEEQINQLEYPLEKLFARKSAGFNDCMDSCLAALFEQFQEELSLVERIAS